MSASSERGGVGKTASRVVAWLLCVGVAVLAVIPFFADARSRTLVPTEESLAEGLKALRGSFKEGDAIRVEPSWWTLPWTGLTDLGESSRRWPFSPLLVSELLDPVEALGHESIWILTGFGRAPDLPESIAKAGRSQEIVYASETVSVSRWALDQVVRVRTLTRDLKSLNVERRAPGGESKACRFGGGKHRCGGETWLDVALEERVVAAREVEWLFVHPGPRDASLSVGWSGLPRRTEKGRTWLFVRVGPSLDAVKHAEGREVKVEVAIDGASVDVFSIAPRRFEMERRAILMPEGEGEVRVTFTITCDDAAWRETMLQADVLDHLPPVLEDWATAVKGR